MNGYGLCLVAFLAGCGNATFIVLTVDATLAVPVEVNRLEVVISEQGGEQIFVTEIQLQAEETFPRRILLEPQGDRATTLVVTVTALLDQTVVARSTALVNWRPGVNNLVDFPSLAPI